MDGTSPFRPLLRGARTRHGVESTHHPRPAYEPETALDQSCNAFMAIRGHRSGALSAGLAGRLHLLIFLANHEEPGTHVRDGNRTALEVRVVAP